MIPDEVRKAVEELCPSYMHIFEKAFSGKSRDAAIRANCIQCMGYQPGLVEGCTCHACPAFLYRLSASQRYQRSKHDHHDVSSVETANEENEGENKPDPENAETAP